MTATEDQQLLDERMSLVAKGARGFRLSAKDSIISVPSGTPSEVSAQPTPAPFTGNCLLCPGKATGIVSVIVHSSATGPRWQQQERLQNSGWAERRPPPGSLEGCRLPLSWGSQGTGMQSRAGDHRERRDTLGPPGRLAWQLSSCGPCSLSCSAAVDPTRAQAPPHPLPLG